ncbi:transmembrane helix motif protein [Ranid herpesvirus 3]|uniref:Transmembrane helix motif protein n=1 Tax=Ranid herpesvirus 3 TaxID=1987509 RepID=A0A1X9T544_9VIRU|nr:transmembrane helix motif protein [Ranid herpesvirus 3]ARR28816.1 transmembrane helix motif protein [Ranid herpesvirus 3]
MKIPRGQRIVQRRSCSSSFMRESNVGWASSASKKLDKCFAVAGPKMISRPFDTTDVGIWVFWLILGGRKGHSTGTAVSSGSTKSASMSRYMLMEVRVVNSWCKIQMNNVERSQSTHS